MAATDRKLSVSFPELDIFRLALGHQRSEDRAQTGELQFSTGKAYRGGAVEVSVSAGAVGDGFFTTVIFGDYRETLESVPAKRVTQKAIDKLHDETLTDDYIRQVKQRAIAIDKLHDETLTDDYIRQVKQRAIAHYARKINEKVGKGESLNVPRDEISSKFAEVNELLAA